MPARRTTSPGRQRPRSDFDTTGSDDWIEAEVASIAELCIKKLHGEERSLRKINTDREAAYLYRTGDYDGALHKFIEILAFFSDGNSYSFQEERASAYANIASCLHLMGVHTALAKAYYERALEWFAAQKQGSIARRLGLTDLSAARRKYVEDRLALLLMGEVPDVSKYLDASGEEKQWEGEATKPTPQKYLHPEDDPANEVSLRDVWNDLPDRRRVRSFASPYDWYQYSREWYSYLSPTAYHYLSPSGWRTWYRGEPPAGMEMNYRGLVEESH